MPGVFSRIEPSTDATRCFVMMPFAESFNAIYRLIQRCCKEQGLVCERADDDVLPGKITSKIYERVGGSGIIIADMTGRNPNVFYELGLAHAISDNVILLTQSTDDVPFDLRDFVHIGYENSFDGAEKLANDLSKVLTTILRSADASTTYRAKELALRTGTSDGKVSEATATGEAPDLGLLHLQAEISRSKGDLNAAKGFLRTAQDLAGRGEGSPGEIGNCAIEAERCRFFDLAERLYETALARNPDHVNNRQCYVSFLLDHRSAKADKLALAEKMLDELETTTERQERTRGLRAQYLTLAPTVDGKSINFEEIADRYVEGVNPTTLEQVTPIVLILQRARQYERLREVMVGLKSRMPPGEAWKADRVLADSFATSSDSVLCDEAASIYKSLIDSEADTSAAVLHNCATLLYAKDREDTDGSVQALWEKAYGLSSSNAGIRKAFAGYLVRHGKQDLAAKVLAGRALQ